MKPSKNHPWRNNFTTKKERYPRDRKDIQSIIMFNFMHGIRKGKLGAMNTGKQLMDNETLTNL